MPSRKPNGQPKCLPDNLKKCGASMRLEGNAALRQIFLQQAIRLWLSDFSTGRKMLTGIEADRNRARFPETLM